MSCKWKCPKCGSTDLRISVEVWAELDQSDPDNFETVEVPSDHVWSEESYMRCRGCDHMSEARMFEVGDEK